jgi:hypothetical protein
MKRHTIHFVKSEFLKRGYTLLSDSYVNNRIKLKYVCSNGHTNSITWHDFEVGKGCPNCAGLAKLNIEYIREMFNYEKYVLLNEEYSNNKQKLKYICPNNHTGLIRWDVWQRGVRCPKCYGNDKIEIDVIKEAFEKDNHKLLSCDYKSNKSKLVCICSFGHKYTPTWNSWQRGSRCPTCKGINHSILYSGPNSSNWQGGLSYEPYCEVWKDKEYKEDIKFRDGYKCLNPCCYSKNPNDLTIHHIDYNKKNCVPNNLITVCRSCNASANIAREWHTAWYQAIIYNRYKRSK